MAAAPEQSLREWVAYLRDLGVYDLYRREASLAVLPPGALERLRSTLTPNVAPKAGPTAPLTRVQDQAAAGIQQKAAASPTRSPASQPASLPSHTLAKVTAAAMPRHAPNPDLPEQGTQQLPPELVAPMPKPNPLAALFPPPTEAVPPQERGAVLERLRAEIGDCTRCPLAYAGRHTIVFGEGDPNAELMFVGEGPGADEDESGRPFVGKAGQLLTNMITAMGLAREQVYIANIVKCRPPGNRTPEFVEGTTCSQFLLRQIDIVQPKVIVALGATAATYVLGVRQSLASLRDQWFRCRESKVAVTYHPAFLLRDPRQKPEAWKDLQRVMKELGLRPPAPKA